MNEETTSSDGQKNQKTRRPGSGSDSWVLVGCIMAAIAVAMGAMGAHFVEDHLETTFADAAVVALVNGEIVDGEEPMSASALVEKYASRWETASRYHLYHSLGLILAGLMLSVRAGLRNAAGWSMLLGIFLFSGCLYASCFMMEAKYLVHIVPIGGMAFILSWTLLAIGLSSRDRHDD